MPKFQPAELVALGYLLGSVPFGLLIARWWKGIDIRQAGSGNIGATNVFRVCGRAAGSTVFVLDVLKGLVPPLVGGAFHFSSPWIIGAALAAIMGHVYSIFLKFKGGKGIATGLGAFLGVAWQVGLLGLGIFAAMLAIFRMVSVASIFGALSLPFSMYYFYPGDKYRLAMAVIAAIIGVYKHRSNIQRILAGTESRVSFKRKRD
jgi:glycerol-3-phosphate acyltransferase PlsY